MKEAGYITDDVVEHDGRDHLMDVEAVFEIADERTEQSACGNADDEDERFDSPPGQAAVADKNGGNEAGQEHLTGDADVEHAGFHGDNHAQRCQQHGGEDA